MSTVEMLRAFVSQRLTAAADEIFEVFERRMAEYEEELDFRSRENQRQRKLLDAVLNPEVRLHRADVMQLLVVKEEVPPEQQEWTSLDQQDPEPPHIKEEQEELQLQGLEEADIKSPFTSVPVKLDEDEEPAAHDETLPSEPQTEASGDCEESKEPRSGLNPLQHNDGPVRDMDCNGEKAPSGSSECAQGHKGHLQNRTAIQKGGKPFSCSVCSERFPRKKSLTAYMRRHSDAKRFSCSVCDTSFGTSSNLVQHRRTHTGEKPCSCSVCGERFSRKSSLVTHMRRHSDAKRFSCSACKTSFGSSSKLLIHMRIHTGEKPYSCSLCSKSFTIHGNLRRHLNVHTGEKPFSCSVCSKRFTQSGHLRQHLKVHTGEKPFICSVCSKSFAQHSNLRRHLAVHTGETIYL